MKRIIIIILVAFLFTCCIPSAMAEDGYDVWLRYKRFESDYLARDYADLCQGIAVREHSPVMNSARQELTRAISGFFGREPVVSDTVDRDGTIILGTLQAWKSLTLAIPQKGIDGLGDEGYLIWPIVYNGKRCTAITGHTDRAVMYGTFHFLRLIQMGERIRDQRIREAPVNTLRMINHSGTSIFQWEKLPKLDVRYRDYGRMLASLGINGVVINNVNTAKPGSAGRKLISSPYMKKMAALATVFRAYGVRLYISVSFASPMLVDGFETADPLDSDVRKWWSDKADEIYRHIPDFGGILVNAYIEGEPGPSVYNRGTHEGANMLAEAFKPHGGLVIWRASPGRGDKDEKDEAMRSYDSFQSLDGQFADNVVIQVKSYPTDFQVRGPVSPLIGAMPKTNQILELQITKQYMGHSTHLSYLAPQWKSVLEFDTHVGATVASVVSGDVFGYKHSGIAGVSDIGADRNWTGHHLAQANMYGFGRLAWDPFISSRQITNEWVSMTFGRNRRVIETISQILYASFNTYEAYRSPLGVGLMCEDDRDLEDRHYLPDPAKRQATTHRADKNGVGFDRTVATGTGFVGQYYPPVRDRFESIETCPDSLLLFMHHVPYTHKLRSQKTVIQHIYDSQFDGVEWAKRLRDAWISIEGWIDNERYEHVLARFDKQIEHARIRRDSITRYFYEMSGIPDEKTRLGRKDNSSQ